MTEKIHGGKGGGEELGNSRQQAMTGKSYFWLAEHQPLFGYYQFQYKMQMAEKKYFGVGFISLLT